ncbi:MAG TPA: hypothetical protein VGD84_16515 [Pseudonocardiaceae bacterium]
MRRRAPWSAGVGFEAVAAVGRFDGTVLKSSLSEAAEAELRQALHGTPAAEHAPR